MSGNTQGLLQPQIFESLQKKIDEETEVREVSSSGQISCDLMLYTNQCQSPSARLCKHSKSKVNFELLYRELFHVDKMTDRSTQAILSRAHSSSTNERQ